MNSSFQSVFKAIIFSIAILASSLSFAEVTQEGIQNLYDLLPSGEYTGTNQKQEPCSVEVLDNAGDTQTLYSVSVTPDSEGSTVTFVIAQGMNGQVGVANASTFGQNFLNVLQITGDDNAKSVVVQKKVGNSNSKAYCSIEL